MAKKIKLSDLGMAQDIDTKVKELKNAGKTKVSIAKELGISIAAVCKIFDQTDNHGEVVLESTYEKVSKLSNNGKNAIEIAQELDITLNSALYWLNKLEKGGKTSIVDDIRRALDEDTYETYHLAQTHSKTPQAIRRIIQQAELQHSPVAEWVKKASKNGILLSTLQRELGIKDLDRAKQVMQENFPKHFISATKYKHPVTKKDDYILLALFTSKPDHERFSVDVSKKKFDYYVSPDGNYMHVKFNDSIPVNKIKFYHLTDLHFGSTAFRKEKLMAILKRIEKDPYCFITLGGDLLENASKYSVGNPLDQYSKINGQLEEFFDCFAPIADRIICSVEDNHVERVERLSEFSLSRTIANLLKTPFFKGMPIIDLEFKDYKTTIAVTHYYAKNCFGQANIVAKVRKLVSDLSFPIKLFLSGHTHCFFLQSEYTTVIIPGHGKTPYEYFIANGGSFMQHTGTYSEEARYNWSPQDTVYFTLDNNGILEVFSDKIGPL